MSVSSSLILFVAFLKTIAASSDCDWECSPIKTCDIIFDDLVAAKFARESQNDLVLNKVIG